VTRPLDVEDDALVRASGRRVAAQTAGLVAVAMAVLVVVIAVVLVRVQRAAADSVLRSAAAAANDVVDPPPGSWLLMATGRQVTTSAGLPEELLPGLARLREGATPQVTLTDLMGGANRRTFRVATQRHGADTVQVVLDGAAARAQRSQLAGSAAFSFAVGLVLAAIVGAFVGRRAVRPLVEGLAMQRSFVADASHELRTPLTLLSTRAQVLDGALRRSDVPDEVLADSRGVIEDVQRLGGVVDDLLAAADPRVDAVRELVEVDALCRSVAESASMYAADRAVTLDSSAAADAAQARVWGSPVALRRAVTALVDNAIDHTPPAGHVHVHTSVRGRSVVVAVSDTGPGLSPEAAATAFGRFHSGGQSAGRAHYGLGLSLARDTATRHGGTLRLAPAAPASGATFELSLPAATDAPDRRGRLRLGMRRGARRRPRIR
jgi:signal transduction histidine kinase